MDKSAPSKESLARARQFNRHFSTCGWRAGRPACFRCESLALEFDAIALGSERNVCQILRGENSSTAAREPLRMSDAMDSYRDAITRERDEVTEKLKRELEKAEGQLDIILRECQGDDDASLANDYGGTGWEKEVPVATVRWHRNRWKNAVRELERRELEGVRWIWEQDFADAYNGGYLTERGRELVQKRIASLSKPAPVERSNENG